MANIGRATSGRNVQLYGLRDAPSKSLAQK